MSRTIRTDAFVTTLYVGPLSQAGADGDRRRVTIETPDQQLLDMSLVDARKLIAHLIRDFPQEFDLGELIDAI